MGSKKDLTVDERALIAAEYKNGGHSYRKIASIFVDFASN